MGSSWRLNDDVSAEHLEAIQEFPSRIMAEETTPTTKHLDLPVRAFDHLIHHTRVDHQENQLENIVKLLEEKKRKMEERRARRKEMRRREGLGEQEEGEQRMRMVKREEMGGYLQVLHVRHPYYPGNLIKN